MSDVLRAYKNDVTEWVIAYSDSDATQVVRETMGWTEEETKDYQEDWYWEECPPDEEFTFTEDDGSKTTKTFAEWVVEAGRCYLATTEY